MEITRRRFVRIVAGTSIVTATAPDYGFAAPAESPDGVLLEAGAFRDTGGWVLDTQFYQQMGGCYLLAHGLGQPVANAIAEVQLPQSGDWHVFVRTKDWCPGQWEAPGRFKVLVNGKPLAAVFGTEAGWGWQKGGSISLPSGNVKVELQDLTGFDGRCDAVYFSKSSDPNLPNDARTLVGWKDRLSGRSKQKVVSENYDVAIVGGGMAGCGAALAADSQGLKVALIQDRPLFGGNASQEVRVHTIGIVGKGGDILNTINTPHYPNGSHEAKKAQLKREATLESSKIRLFPNHLAVGLQLDGKRIVSVDARQSQTGIIKRFEAPVFVDCTGNGWLGFWAGAEFRYGRESHQEFGEQWDKHGDLWSPEKADNRIMGTSVLWNSYEADKPSTFPEVPWAAPVATTKIAVNGEWYWEYSSNDLNQIDDAEQMRDHLLRAIYGSFANAKKDPKHARTTLWWVAYIGGKRESRRIMGDYIYSMRDMLERRGFPDAVVEEKRDIDTHYQIKEKGSPYDFLSQAIFRKTGGPYYLPFRCFCSKDVANLMMAGRCFSCTHIGLSGPRIMNTCGQMGIATGYAAALCKKHGVKPREVGQKHIEELRRMIGYV